MSYTQNCLKQKEDQSKAISLLINNKYEQAKDVYEECVSCFSKIQDYGNAKFKSKVYGHLGQTYFYLKNYKKAVENYTAAIAERPDFVDAYIKRSHAKQMLNQMKEALEDMKTAYSIKPNESIKKQIQKLKQKLNPQFKNPAQKSGLLKDKQQERLNQPQKMQKQLESEEQMDPIAKLRYQGDKLMRNKEYLQAVKVYSECISKFQQSKDQSNKACVSSIYQNLGFCYQEIANHQKAEEMFTQAIHNLHIQRANARKMQNKDKQAIEDLETAYQMMPVESLKTEISLLKQKQIPVKAKPKEKLKENPKEKPKEKAKPEPQQNQPKDQPKRRKSRRNRNRKKKQATAPKKATPQMTHKANPLKQQKQLTVIPEIPKKIPVVPKKKPEPKPKKKAGGGLFAGVLAKNPPKGPRKKGNKPKAKPNKRIRFQLPQKVESKKTKRSKQNSMDAMLLKRKMDADSSSSDEESEEEEEDNQDEIRQRNANKGYQRIGPKHYSLPGQLFSRLKYIDGKMIRTDKKKQQKGKVKTKRGLKFNLEPKVFEDKNNKWKKMKIQEIPKFKGKKTNLSKQQRSRVMKQTKHQRRSRRSASGPISMSAIRFIDKPMKKSRNKVKKGKVKTKRGMRFSLEEQVLDEKSKMHATLYGRLDTLQEVDEGSDSNDSANKNTNSTKNTSKKEQQTH